MKLVKRLSLFAVLLAFVFTLAACSNVSQKYADKVNKAAEEGDEFNFKNAEHAQLVSDIAMFDNAGKMEDLVTLIDSAFDTSDENLASIVENTTTTLEDGSKIDIESLSLPQMQTLIKEMVGIPEGSGISDFIGLLC
jgi:DNA repair ATPase RecN